MPKSKKDPNKPKGVKSAYIYFTEAQKKQHEERGEEISFTELSKYCGAKWKELSDEDKEEYVALANKDRKRYDKEMESYNPPSDSDSDDDKPKKKKKKVKDPNAPKKNITAYFHFAAAKRPEVKAEDPDIPVTEVAQRIGEKWRNLTDEEKLPYQKLAEKDKARYLREFAKYQSTLE